MLSQLRQQAKSAREAGEIASALKLYRQIWYEYPQDRSEWDAWGYARCYYAQKDYRRAFAVLKAARELAPEASRLKNLQAWCLYHLVLKADTLPADVDTQAMEILRLSQPEDPYGPWQRTVFRMLNHYREPFDAPRMLDWLARIDPASLSREAETYQQGEKVRRLPSPWLRYVGRQSEALLRTEAFAACERLCREVLSAADTVVPGSQRIWFERRLARCLVAMGQTQEAIVLYRCLVKRKPDWFLLHELAGALRQGQAGAEALAVAARAALAPGEPEKKLRLYRLLAELVADTDAELARQHRLLEAALRAQNGWRLSDEQAELLKTGGETSLAERFRALHPLWRNWAGEKTEQRVNGRIEKLLPHGQAGFLRLERGETVYFRTADFLDGSERLSAGTRVSCRLKEGFDAKKQKSALQAVSIRCLAPGPA